jgi:ribose transport system ATP-binding protein
VDWLLDLARKRADAGKLVLYISHRLDEVRRVADRVTVLRNGETVGTETTSSLGDDDIVAMMLGRRLDRLFPVRTGTAMPEVALEVQNLRVGHQLRGVDLRLHSGEVLGVAGLQGHGQRELFMALYGAERAEGEIRVRGKPVSVRGPRQALSKALGIALLPEDRRNQGLLLGKPIRENIVLSALDKIVRRGLVDASAERKLVADAVAQLNVKAGSIDQVAGTLSGGNQQKVVLAKLLATDARILLFYDPTRGVDVGTKAEIFTLMRDLAARGFAILFYSTDLAEVANVADRTLVMSYGRITATLAGDDMTEAAILRATLAQKADA